jgi:hypothetical protein
VILAIDSKEKVPYGQISVAEKRPSRLAGCFAYPVNFASIEADLVSIERFSAIHTAGIDREDDVAVVTDFKIGFFQWLVIDTEAISWASGRTNVDAHAAPPVFSPSQRAAYGKRSTTLYTSLA